MSRCNQKCSTGNRIFLAEDPDDRTPLGTVCTKEGDLWINPQLCLIYVFTGRCWKLANCAKVTIETPPCDAQLVWFDNGFKAGELIDTQAEIPPNREVVFCGPEGLSLGFLPNGASALQPPVDCGDVPCDANFLLYDPLTQTTSCGALLGPNDLPCAPTLVYCAAGELQLGQVGTPGTIPCDPTTSLLFCDGTNIAQAPIFDADEVNCEPQLVFCGDNGISRGSVLTGDPLTCTDSFVVCDGTTWRQAELGASAAVECQPQLLVCTDAGVGIGTVNDGAPLTCADSFVVCDGQGWRQAAIGGTGATLGPSNDVLFCNDSGQIALGHLPTTWALHAQNVKNDQPITTTTLTTWGTLLNDFGAAWNQAFGTFTAPSDGLYEINFTGVLQFTFPSTGSFTSLRYVAQVFQGASQLTAPDFAGVLPTSQAAYLWVPGGGDVSGARGEYWAASVLARLPAGTVVTVALQMETNAGSSNQTDVNFAADLTIKLLP